MSGLKHKKWDKNEALNWEKFEKMLQGSVTPEAYIYLNFDSETYVHAANGFYRLTTYYEKIIDEESSTQDVMTTDIEISSSTNTTPSSRFLIQQHPMDRNFVLMKVGKEMNDKKDDQSGNENVGQVIQSVPIRTIAEGQKSHDRFRDKVNVHGLIMYRNKIDALKKRKKRDMTLENDFQIQQLEENMQHMMQTYDRKIQEMEFQIQEQDSQIDKIKKEHVSQVTNFKNTIQQLEENSDIQAKTIKTLTKKNTNLEKNRKEENTNFEKIIENCKNELKQMEGKLKLENEKIEFAEEKHKEQISKMKNKFSKTKIEMEEKYLREKESYEKQMKNLENSKSEPLQKQLSECKYNENVLQDKVYELNKFQMKKLKHSIRKWASWENKLQI
jgi:hypothetical protein